MVQKIMAGLDLREVEPTSGYHFISLLKIRLSIDASSSSSPAM